MLSPNGCSSTKDDAPDSGFFSWVLLVVLIFDLIMLLSNGYPVLVSLALYGVLCFHFWTVTAIIALGNTAVYMFCTMQSTLPCPCTVDRLAEIERALEILSVPASDAAILV